MFPTQVFHNIFTKEECDKLKEAVDFMYKNYKDGEWDDYKINKGLILDGGIIDDDEYNTLIEQTINKIVTHINSVQKIQFRFWGAVYINYYKNETKYFPAHNHNHKKIAYDDLYDYAISLSLGDTRVFEIGGPVTEEHWYQELDPGEEHPEYYHMNHGQVILFDGYRNHGLLKETIKKKERISILFPLTEL